MKKYIWVLLSLSVVLAGAWLAGSSAKALAQDTFVGGGCDFPGAAQAISDAQAEKILHSGSGASDLKQTTLKTTCLKIPGRPDNWCEGGEDSEN